MGFSVCLSCVAGRYIEKPIGSECYAAAVVIRRAGNAVNNDGTIGEGRAGKHIPFDAVDGFPVFLRRQIEIEVLVLGKIRMEGKTEQTAFTDVSDARNRNYGATSINFSELSRPFGNQEFSGRFSCGRRRKQHHFPRNFKVFGDYFTVNRFALRYPSRFRRYVFAGELTANCTICPGRLKGKSYQGSSEDEYRHRKRNDTRDKYGKNDSLSAHSLITV